MAMDALIRAAESARSFDPAKVVEAVRRLDYAGLAGHISYDDSGDLREQRVYIFQVRDGEFVQVAP
jgi:branched-chain amino acid transport system substrate-binding protein